LNDVQRQAIKHYLEKKPTLMGGKIRQLRMKVKTLDFDQMIIDIALLRQLKELKIPKGRRGGDVVAGFTVKQSKETTDAVAGFKVGPGTPEKKK
jgi:hypothetical protein